MSKPGWGRWRTTILWMELQWTWLRLPNPGRSQFHSCLHGCWRTARYCCWSIQQVGKRIKFIVSHHSLFLWPGPWLRLSLPIFANYFQFSQIQIVVAVSIRIQFGDCTDGFCKSFLAAGAPSNLTRSRVRNSLWLLKYPRWKRQIFKSYWNWHLASISENIFWSFLILAKPDAIHCRLVFYRICSQRWVKI